MTNKTEVTERAMRRDSAIEKNRNVFLEMALEHEKNRKILNEFHLMWVKVPDILLDLLHLVIRMAGVESVAERLSIESMVQDKIHELSRLAKQSSLDEILVDLNLKGHAWNEILIWLEIDSQRSLESIEEMAATLKIPIDKNDRLWAQKTLNKISGRDEKKS
jgi:hypothetical protein